jgi:hypothetical protein
MQKAHRFSAWQRGPLSWHKPPTAGPGYPRIEGNLHRLKPVLSAAAALLAALLGMFAAGCRKIHHTDVTPLDTIGMSYSALQDLRTLEVADAEVPELLKAKQAGITDPMCVELVRIARDRKEHFHSGDGVAALRQVGVSEETIVELARLDQLGLGAGELQAMRLTGLSEAVILEVARRHAEGKPTFSGAALAHLKDTGLGEPAMIELVRRGVADDQKDTIVALRRRGVRDSAIVSRYGAR